MYSKEDLEGIHHSCSDNVAERIVIESNHNQECNLEISHIVVPVVRKIWNKNCYRSNDAFNVEETLRDVPPLVTEAAQDG